MAGQVARRGGWLLLLMLFSMEMAAAMPRCLLVYSYHVGYPWNDAIDRSATELLQGRCEIERIYMDSKRNPDERYIRQQADLAFLKIEQWQPDVIIAVDDNASKFLVAPYLKDHPIPVIFCGLNWDIKEYGYPYRNTTGMIEIAPLEPLLLQSQQLLHHQLPSRTVPLQLTFIDADRLSARKEFEHIKAQFESPQLQIEGRFVETFQQWQQAFEQGQQGDIILLLNNAGIEGWNDREASRIVANGKTFSITSHDWMRHWSMLTMAKEPEEQGEWAAEVAQLILEGVVPSAIDHAKNRRWRSYVNLPLLKQAGITLPSSLMKRAEWIE